MRKKRKYTKRPMTPKRILGMVSRIRARNNRVWMQLVELAVAVKPRKAKKIIRQITANDREVTRWLSRF